jgi:two-component system C4-dicarboxylate transport response regulator DctD
MALQVKLLRVLQERRLERLGGNEGVALDCRIVAATKVDLLQLAAQGLFREDLYYRIGVVSLELPRLRDRRDDIPLLLADFVRDAALRYQRPIPDWTAQQMAQWQAGDWPGNVRELRNFAERLVLGVAGAVPAAASAPSATAAPTPASAAAARNLPHQSDAPSSQELAAEALPLPQQVDHYERELITQALASVDGNVAQAADNLMVPRKTLYDKLKKYQIGTGRK